MDNMNDNPNLVTIFTFKEKLYLVKMYVMSGNTLELSVTDKFTAEEWRCSYDATYIENLTHKTGNYKQFDVFVTMLKSGLLKTSECVALDLLTVEDLESLRTRRISGKASCGLPRSSQTRIGNTGNRRYLILTYSVEFDRIHYPLPLEYCGPPDPQILQGIIRKLEADVERLQEQLNAPGRMQLENREEVMKLRKRVEELSLENKSLIDEVRQLNKKLLKRVNSFQQLESMQVVMKAIEEQVMQERTSFQRLLHKLRDEKTHLQQQVDQLRVTERSLRNRLRFTTTQHGALGGGGAAVVAAVRTSGGGGPARAPGDGLSPAAAAAAAARGDIGRRVRAVDVFAAQRNGGKVPSAAPPLVELLRPRVINASPRKITSSCNHHTLSQTRSAGCCHIKSQRHRSSSESSCNSQRVSPNTRKSTGGICSNSFHPNHIQQQRMVKSRSRFTTALTSERNKIKKQSKYQRSCSECSSCSRPHSCCSKRDGSGNCSTSASSRTGQNGSGDRKHRRSHKQNRDVKRGMSDLEDRIKALQKLLKDGLPAE